MRIRVFGLVFVLLCVVMVLPSAAQTVNNPTQVQWNPSADHSAVTSYEVAYFIGGAAAPVSPPVDLGKPTPDAQNVCTANINTQPLGFNTYTAKMRAKVVVDAATTLYSDWSDPSNPFQRVPGKPGKPVPK